VATPLSAIVTDAKDLADMLNNPLVADPTWRRWANQGQERLYRMLSIKAPARFHATTSFTLTGLGGNTVALPAGFRQLRDSGVTKDPTVPSLRHTLRRFNFGERDAQGQLPAWGAGRELAFDIQASNVVVEPASLCAGNYAMYWLQGPTPWLTDGSQDGTAIATVLEPYVDFIAHWMAIKGARKDDNNETADEIKNDLAQLADEIQAEFNDSSDPATIIDQAQVGGIFWP
jgi:hypothetical protein